MSHQGDARIEAAARQKPEPTQGPDIRPRIVHDNDGQYTIYTGLHCGRPGCDLQLTSRNRAGKRLLCHEHERERSRNVKAAAREAKGAPKGKPKGKPGEADEQSIRIANPAHRAVHAALTYWLNFPTDAAATDRLQTALVDHELRHRLRQLLPWVPAPPQGLPSIPVDEPVFNNPEHRTTRLEFLADADHYGV